MQRYTALALGVTAAIVILGLTGCDSGDGTDANVGSLGIKMLWPGVAPAYADGSLMVSVEVRLLDLDLTSRPRADNPGFIDLPTELLGFDNVPAGNYIIQAIAYCELGELVGKTEFPVLVLPDQYLEYAMTADSAACGVNATPNPVRLQAGETKRVIATLLNDMGIRVLVAPTLAFEWSITEGPPSLTVDQEGRITTPPLAEIPVVGKLFVSHTASSTSTELLIFVTPTLVGPDE